MSGSVLIVDDSAMVRRQVRTALLSAGYGSTEAVDGSDALAKLTGDTWLIVCDVTMPKMDGLEFLQALRAIPAYAKVPVIMLTTEGRPEMIAKARALGTVGWLVKPFRAEILLSAVGAVSGRT